MPWPSSSSWPRSPRGRSCPPGTCPATAPGTCGIRLHLRLHPGKGFAHLFSLWLRWGRLAALRRSSRIRPALPLRYRLLDPREHSVFLGRAHYRHGLRVPLEEHILVMAPPRTFKTAFLADVILRYRGPVIATTTKADLFKLTSTVRSMLGPVHVFNPQHIGGVPSTFCWSTISIFGLCPETAFQWSQDAMASRFWMALERSLEVLAPMDRDLPARLHLPRRRRRPATPARRQLRPRRRTHPITVPELLRLLRNTVIPPPRRDQAHRPHWSAWRRRHQHRARQAHQRWNTYAETTP